MRIFFGLMILMGAAFVWLEYEARRVSDSIPAGLADHGGLGVALISVGVVGTCCVWL